MVLVQSFVAVSLCVLGLSLSLVSGQLAGDRLAPHQSATGVDLTNRILSFDDFGIGTGTPPAFRCYINNEGNNWYDPTGTGLYTGNAATNRVGDRPGANEILLTGYRRYPDTGLLLHRGASYYEMDGLWCCGPSGGRDLNNNRCVYFTPCPTLPVLTNGVITYNRDTNVATYSCDNGYRLEGNDGSTTRTCSGTTISAGTWSGSQPSCVVVCPDIPPGEMLVDGSVEYFEGTASSSGTTNARPVGVRATFTCDTGFFFVFNSGTVNRNCQSDRTWSGSTPRCETVCPDLSVPANTAIAYSGVSANSADEPYSPDGGSTNARPVGIVATYSCTDSQFTLVGSATRTCQSDRSWSGSEPSCQIPCDNLSDVTNGEISYDSDVILDNKRPENTVVSYQCDVGFTRRGPENRVCREGSWSGSPSTCTVTDCGPLTPPPHGSITTLHGSTTIGSLVMYSCDSCSDLVGVANRVCSADELWVPEAPICDVKQCSPPPPPVNGGVTLSPDSSCGSQVIYHCDPGYLVMGSDARTCQPSGDWSGTAHACEALDCGPLSAPQNGHITISSTDYLGVATYSCIDGFILTGPRQRTCIVIGIWTLDPPLCNPVDCGPLDPPANGLVDTSSGTTFTSEAVCSCVVGYNLIGAAVRTCGANGRWQPVAPTCRIVDCGPLSHPINGAVRTDPGTTYNSVALYSCDNGYNINGPSQRTCTATGQWTDTSPTCDAVDCGPLPALHNGSLVTSEGTLFPSVASYSCDPGYNLTGCSTAQCQADGTWSCDPPFCADNVYIQLKFGPTRHCVEWSDWKVELLFTKMRSLILRAIQRYGNNKVLPKENIAPGYFSCFLSMTQASYRTRITGTESVSAVEFAAMIQSWVESGVSSRLQWYIIKIDKNCPARIESMEEDECSN